MISLISAKVLIKIRNSIDTLCKLLTCVLLYCERSAAVDGFFYSRFTFKLSFVFRLSTWKWLVSSGNHTTISSTTISDWFDLFWFIIWPSSYKVSLTFALLNRIQPILKILKENITKPWKFLIIDRSKWC